MASSHTLWSPAPWVALALLLTGCATGTGTAATAPVIEVSGRPVPAAGLDTVHDALQRAHVVVPSGRVLTAVSRRPIAGDHQPGQVLLDGRPVTADAAVFPGSVVTVVAGQDVTEPLAVTSERVPPGEGQASLYVDGRPGRVRVVRGAWSGEMLSRHLVVAPLRGHLVARRAVALTFDDGPDPTWTPLVLRMLAAAKVHATFCVVGREVVRYPALMRAIRRGGHAFCNHSWSHDEQLADRSPEDIRSELQRTQDAVREATGITPTLFRAPGGFTSPALEAEARGQGMSMLGWTVDPRDWTRPGVASILRVASSTVRPGSVVLLHDGGGDRSQTLAALHLLLARLVAAGYSFRLPTTAA